MNWSRTQLIFIVTFLVLDLFLGFQLYDKREHADQVLPLEEKTLQQKLDASDIKLPPKMPETESAAYIKGTAQAFATEQPVDNEKNNPKKDKQKPKKVLLPELAKLETQNGKKIQQISVTGDHNTIISSKLVDPVKIPDHPTSSDISTFLNTYVYKGSEYHLWKWDEATSSFLFVQMYHNRPIFTKNRVRNGSLQLLTKDGKVIGYEQTYLDLKKYSKNKDILKPLQAIGNLFKDNDLTVGDTVESMEIGYYNLIEQDLGESKVFVPVWHVWIKPKGSKEHKEYFVNALTGVIQTLDQQPETDTDTTIQAGGNDGT